MKTRNKDNRSARKALAQLAAIIALVAIVAGVYLAFNQLRNLWIEQCQITDINQQVEIQVRNSANTGAILEMFGLRNGANLATIDFAEKREAVMKSMPNIKAINITRHLPDRITIAVIERDPFARMGISGAKKDSGRVCDDEGVVYKLRRGAEMLPIIREVVENGTPVGRHLEGHSRAALSVLRVASEAQFMHLNILEIDTAKPDYLLITLANYSAIKFRWEGMEKPTPESDAALRAQLTCVSQTIATNLSGATKVWNATQPGVVTADSNRAN